MKEKDDKQMPQMTQKKYKTRHEWVGTVIQWEIWKRLKFDDTYKGYVHKTEPIFQNETY